MLLRSFSAPGIDSPMKLVSTEQFRGSCGVMVRGCSFVRGPLCKMVDLPVWILEYYRYINTFKLFYVLYNLYL